MFVIEKKKLEGFATETSGRWKGNCFVNDFLVRVRQEKSS